MQKKVDKRYKRKVNGKTPKKRNIPTNYAGYIAKFGCRNDVVAKAIWGR